MAPIYRTDTRVVLIILSSLSQSGLTEEGKMSEFLSFFLELPLEQEISGSISWAFLFLVGGEMLTLAVFVFDLPVTGTI